MTISSEWLRQLSNALPARMATGVRCFIVALVALHAAPVHAQAAGEVLQPWNCLTNSVAAGSWFGTFVAAPGCPVPAVTWSAPGIASAIVPPGTPNGLAATVTGRTVVLKWTPPAAGGAPTSYLVQAGSASGLADLVSANTESALPTLTATGVPAGTYFVRVLARNPSGTSAASNEISVKVGASVRPGAVSSPAVCTVPPASTALVATQDGNRSVTFVWRAGEGDCQAFALPLGYYLDYGTSPGATAGSLTVPDQPTTVTVPLVGVGPGIYYVRVRGFNSFGASPPSNEVIVRVGGVCSGAPSTPTNLAGSVAGGTVVFTWIDPSPFQNAPTGYRFAGGVEPMVSLAQWGVSGEVFRLNGVPAGSYYFWVSGVNACGSSPDSAPIFVTVGGPTVPVVVTGVHQFAGAPADGANFSTLILGRDGNFYGTSVSGGPLNSRCVANLDGCGTVFKMTPSGAFTVQSTFGSNGSSPVYPYSRLFQSTDGNFWGTTTGQESGNGAASVFKMSSTGSNSFITELGGPSYGALIQGSDGSFFGTTVDNGPGTCSWRSTQCAPSAGSGTIFKVTSGGTLTYLHTFNGTDGSKPYAGLLQAADGMFWGTTSAGGASGFGTIYKMTSGGAFTTVYSFRGGTDGANPAYSAMLLASDGNFYGTTQFGGGTPNAGTVFKMTPAGVLTILHAFTGILVRTGEPLPTSAMDGLQPGAGLVEGPDGKLYGVAGGGGGFAGGTAFNVTKDGTYTQLYAFDGGSTGGSPTATLVLGPDGNLWGTAQYGGTYNRGVIFKMTLPR